MRTAKSKKTDQPTKELNLGQTPRRPDYEGGWSYVNLRLPLSMLEELDQHLSSMRPKIHRMHWIIEAIVEKMDRET